MSVFVVRAFVRLRQALAGRSDIGRKLDELAAHVGFHDKAIAVLFDEIKKLAAPPPELPEPEPRRRMGFKTPAQREAEEAKRRR